MDKERALRQATARARLEQALASVHAEARLSDVFFDALSDDDGYDCDDLACVLYDRLKAL